MGLAGHAGNCITYDICYANLMDLQKVDWTLFRSFLAVVDAGSLLGAARRLGSHQPTLSRHITELESQLGVSLFERTGRGVTPTAAGRAIVESARRMAEAAGEVEVRLRGAGDPLAGTVRLAASEVMAAFILPPILAHLSAKYPRLQIDLVASNQISNLLRREADIAVRMVRPTQASLIGRRLGDLVLGLYASEGYLRRAGEPETPADLAGRALVGLDTDDSLIRGFQAVGAGVTRDHFAVRTDNQVAYIRLVEAGAGIGVVPNVVAQDLDRLVRIFPDQSAAALPAWLVTHREIGDNPLIRAVFDTLAAEIPGALRINDR